MAITQSRLLALLDAAQDYQQAHAKIRFEVKLAIEGLEGVRQNVSVEDILAVLHIQLNHTLNDEATSKTTIALEDDRIRRNYRENYNRAAKARLKRQKLTGRPQVEETRTAGPTIKQLREFEARARVWDQRSTTGEISSHTRPEHANSLPKLRPGRFDAEIAAMEQFDQENERRKQAGLEPLPVSIPEDLRGSDNKEPPPEPKPVYIPQKLQPDQDEIEHDTFAPVKGESNV